MKSILTEIYEARDDRDHAEAIMRDKVIDALNEGRSIMSIARAAGMGRATVYRIKEAMQDDDE